MNVKSYWHHTAKLLIDMNLSPRWVDMQYASDDKITAHAKANDFIVLTDDHPRQRQFDGLTAKLSTLGGCPRIAIVARARLVEQDFSII